MRLPNGHTEMIAIVVITLITGMVLGSLVENVINPRSTAPKCFDRQQAAVIFNACLKQNRSHADCLAAAEAIAAVPYKDVK